ncbi:MAG: acetate--CoA ligase family protein, partial [Gammaproteobacteria bacterium]|nr:acetate--CoA ligase family protein [Gammaproteobacteria bacterium]
IVEEMVGPTVVEIIVGVSRDRNFGLSLLLGVGGTLVELIEDAAFLLLPLQRADVDRALGALRIARLLDGYRGQPGGDRDALVTAVENIGRFAEAYSDSLHELDVNPILVMPHGVVAADALIRKTKNH